MRIIGKRVSIQSQIQSANWIEIDEGVDSGDTYLWPYFYTASRFVDKESINKKGGVVIYRELINARKAISKNVLSLIVLKKSSCDGQKVQKITPTQIRKIIFLVKRK